jgi:hypothetical protein
MNETYKKGSWKIQENWGMTEMMREVIKFTRKPGDD